MSDSPKRECGTCLYKGMQESHQSAHSECRRHAPVVSDEFPGHRFPRVQYFDWCGDFEPRSTKPADD